MKLSELSTERAADALCRVTPLIDNIVQDQDLVEIIGKAVDFNGLSVAGKYMEVSHRFLQVTPIILKTHKKDLFGILAAINDKTPAEIAEQPVMETMAQVREVLQDEALIDFFTMFASAGGKK